ncbi:hypothetical protein K456DRAFT_1663007 [Colletotrichum gloeosporioides 23]|nr:hypothetical protein K456DRAFT_1663007 [Colletotrichum gloeosporioides 23]
MRSLASRLIPDRVASWPLGAGRVVPSLARLSASSFPLMPSCPGDQWVRMSYILAASWISRKAACEESGTLPRIPWITLVLSIQMCIGWPWEVRKACRSPALAPSASPSNTSAKPRRPQPWAIRLFLRYITKPNPITVLSQAWKVLAAISFVCVTIGL